MNNKIIFVMICLMAIAGRIAVFAQNGAGGGNENRNLPRPYDFTQLRPQESNPTSPNPQQQQQNIVNSYFGGSQLNLPFLPNPANSALNQQQFNRPALNFQPPTQPQLNNVNYSPPQLFNPQADNVIRIQFEVMNENQGNSIEQGCNPEPIVGQFKTELVDLANGGPLTRLITTCGSDTDCKTIALQSDLNRVQAVLPRGTYNQNQISQNQISQNQNRLQQGAFRGYNINQEGRGNAGRFVNDAVALNSLFRAPSRRLIQYTEILEDDFYN